MANSKIEAYFAERQQQISLPVRLFALVDALLYGATEGAPPLDRSTASIALFDGTPDASLADAGPWLIDYQSASVPLRNALGSMASGPAGVSWLISAYPFSALAGELQERLDVRLPDGHIALFRFYDARIMPAMAALMDFMQRMQFFVTTHHWLVELNGQLTGVHPHA